VFQNLQDRPLTVPGLDKLMWSDFFYGRSNFAVKTLKVRVHNSAIIYNMRRQTKFKIS